MMHGADQLQRNAARIGQLTELMGRGFGAHEAAPYCDGTSDVDVLATLIASDAAALHGEEEQLRVVGGTGVGGGGNGHGHGAAAAGAGGPLRAPRGGGGRPGTPRASTACVIS